MRKVDNDPILVTTVARIFWGERRLDKAINWFEKALLLDSWVSSSIDFLKDDGDTTKRTVELDWYMELRSRQPSGPFRQRRQVSGLASSLYVEFRADAPMECYFAA